MSTITRRELMAGTAATLFMDGCANRQAEVYPQPAGPKPLVSIVRAPEYSQDLYDTVRRMLAEHRLDVRNKRVVLKPNLVEFDRNTAINTHPLLVHATLEAFRAMGAADVRIAEGPGHRRNTLDLADAAGYFDAVPRFEQLFTDLNLDELSKHTLHQPFSKLRDVYLPNTILGADLVVTMPKMKTHHWVGVTLAMKNFFGIVPGAVYGWPKNVLHWSGIHECIVDLQGVPARTFAVVDGITGMEGNGPIQGTAKHCGVVVAGRVLSAVDAACARIMGIDPFRVGYLNAPGRVHYNEEESVVYGAELPRSVRSDFNLVKEFAHIRLT